MISDPFETLTEIALQLYKNDVFTKHEFDLANTQIVDLMSQYTKKVPESEEKEETLESLRIKIMEKSLIIELMNKADTDLRGDLELADNLVMGLLQGINLETKSMILEDEYMQKLSDYIDKRNLAVEEEEE